MCLELLLHARARPENTRFDCGDSDSHVACQLAMRPTFYFVQQESLSKRGMQMLKGLCSQFAGHVLEFRIKVLIFRLRHYAFFMFRTRRVGQTSGIFGMLFANLHQSFVDGDTHQPGRETRAPFKPMQVLVHLAENILKIVFRVLMIL